MIVGGGGDSGGLGGELVMMEKKMGAVSAFLLERYNVDEVMAEERAALEQALATDETLAGRLAALRESDAAIRERYLPAGTERAFPVRRRLATQLLRHVPRRMAAVATAVATVCLVVSALWGLRDRLPEGDRAKGGLPETSLAVYLKTDAASPEALSVSDAASPSNGRVTLHEGDTIQLAYTAVAPGDANANSPVYGVIFSIDGRSALTLHYPSMADAMADGAARLESGKRTALNEAYTLDDAPRFEVFFMVVSAEPPDVKAVLDKARLLAEEASQDRFAEDAAAASARVFPGFEVKAVVIYKGPTGF